LKPLVLVVHELMIIDRILNKEKCRKYFFHLFIIKKL